MGNASDHPIVGAQDVASNATSFTPRSNLVDDPTGEDYPSQEDLEHSLLVFYIVIFIMIAAQSALVTWRKRHRRSYDLVTAIGLWIIPAVVSFVLGFWRFIAIWLVYSLVTGYILYRCSMSRYIDTSTPRLVYRWFFSAFKASVAVGATGYALLVVMMFGSGIILTTYEMDATIPLVMAFYGLYFGILTRDCAEIASDRMAARLGTRRRMAVRVRECALCGGELRDAMSTAPVQGGDAMLGPKTGESGGFSASEASIQLPCKHIFHSDCVRGWTIVGKKEECPACGEKVDLRALYANKPWETRNLSWIQMLDMFRYMLVWQPTILIGLHFVLHAFHLDEMPASMENDRSIGNGTKPQMDAGESFNTTSV